MKQVIRTFVYGVSIDVLLDIDLAGLANALGAKAGKARGRKSKLAHGLIVASVSAADQTMVKERLALAGNKMLRAVKWKPAPDPIDQGDNQGESPDC